MKKDRSYKKILIFLTIIVMGLFFLIYFLYTDIKRINEHISILEQDLTYQIKKRQYILSLQRTLQNTDSDITRIENSIIPKNDEVKFIENLESMARKNDLSIDIDSLGFEDSQIFSSSTVTTLKIKAKTKGSWAGTYKFLAEIESMPFKVKVNSFGLSNSIGESTANSKSPKQVILWNTIFDINVLKYK